MVDCIVNIKIRRSNVMGMGSGIFCLIVGFLSALIFFFLGSEENKLYFMGLIGSSIFIVGGFILLQLHWMMVQNKQK